MNIILSSLDEQGIRITKKTEVESNGNIGIDIDSIQLFIAKSIESPETINIALQKEGDSIPKYILNKINYKNLEKDRFLGYKLIPMFNVPYGSYSFIISQGDIIITSELFSIVDSNILIDEHEPSRIINRTIGPINSKIIAQDVNSQQLSFYIRKKYDGVSFIDSNKSIWFDYVPLDPNDLKNNLVIDENGESVVPTFLSSGDIEVVENILPPFEQEGEWVLLKWTPPYLATKVAGQVSFALSIVSTRGERTYTWQTEPSSFEVLPNIGFRVGAVATHSEKTNFNQLFDRVDSIETFLGNNTDDIPSNDQELVVGGGSAEEYFE